MEITLSESQLQVIAIAITVIAIVIVYKILRWLWDVGFFTFLFMKIIVPSTVGIIIAVGAFSVTGEVGVGAGGGFVVALMTLAALSNYG